MATLLLIETSTALCSVALSKDGSIIASRQNSERQHASLTAPFIKEVLDEGGITASDCDAVCVSMGPGSYTGLRVGVSSAKGLCFGASIPLLAITSLETLVWQAIGSGAVPEGCRYIVPMIDARRMEVYAAVYSPDGKLVKDTEPVIVDENSFSSELSEGKVLFIGDSALKCKGVISSSNACFMECCPQASSMLAPALEEFKEKRFKDIAYFEPFYLKEFTATVSKKKLF